MRPAGGQRQRHGTEARPRRRSHVARGFLERRIHRRERRRRDPHGKHQSMRCMDKNDAEDRPVEADLVEHPRDVHVNRQIGKRLRQKECDQDQAAPTQLESRQRIAGGNGNDQGKHDGQQRDPDAQAQRFERVAAGTEHARPERESEFLRNLVREIPFLGERPQKQVGKRSEYREREQCEHHGDAEHPRPARDRVRAHIFFAVCCR